MKSNSEIQLLLANDRIRDRVLDAARAHLAQPEIRPSIRRSLGHQIIRIGERLAEDPHLQPARFR